MWVCYLVLCRWCDLFLLQKDVFSIYRYHVAGGWGRRISETCGGRWWRGEYFWRRRRRRVRWLTERRKFTRSGKRRWPWIRSRWGCGYLTRRQFDRYKECNSLLVFGWKILGQGTLSYFGRAKHFSFVFWIQDLSCCGHDEIRGETKKNKRLSKYLNKWCCSQNI